MNLPDSTHRRDKAGASLVFVALAAGVVAAAIGLLALVGWFFQLPLLTSVEADWIPMAPSTAGLFLLYGGAVCLRARRRVSLRAKQVSRAMVGLGMLVALLLFTLASLNIHWGVEHIGLNIADKPGEMLIGHMSPVNALCFVIAGISFLASLSPDKNPFWRSALALGAAGLLLGSCFVFLLAYIFGAPLLYGGTFIPPALNSILAFISLGLALLAMASRSSGAWDGSPDGGHGTAFLFILIFAIMAAGMVTGGYRYYRNYEQNFFFETGRQLSTIADLKVDQLVQYRKERLGDANVFYNNSAFSEDVRQFLEQSASADARRRLQAWLGKFQSYYEYSRIYLLDVQGVERLAVPDRPEPLHEHLATDAAAVLKSRQVTFLDFERDGPGLPVELEILVPIYDQSDTNRPLGVLGLRIDPRTRLYPFIKQWPVPTATAETLLVRREGNEVVFLNDLRFQTNAALNLRRSLEQTNLLAVKAVLGQTGIVEGVDYRNEPVIGDLSAVPGSPWFLVAWEDVAEVFAPARERFWQVVYMLGVLLLAAGAGLGLIWRQLRVRFYREKFEAEADRARLGAIVESSHDAIIGKNLDGVITSWNLGAQHIYGYSAAEVVGKSIAILIPPGHLEEFTRLMEKVRRGEPVVNHDAERIRKDGERIQVSLTLSPVRDASGKIVGVSAIGCDITERKRAEEKLRRVLAELERSNKELEQFAYIASHDLQEPLRMVSSYTQLLAKRFEGQLDEKTQKYVHYAVDGAFRMKTLINDLLTYSRVGRRGKPPEPADSSAVLGEALRNLAALVEENRAVITHENLPTVCADGSQLVLVFQNLIANAIKFRRADVPRIHVSAQDKGGEWVFAVKDNGIGIESRHADRIFVIFQRLHTHEEYSGNGIGLAVCKRVVERHGGKIWFESEPGKGATFFFTIPK